MIENDTFGLGGFELVESSEQGMLSAVARAARSEDHIVFLGWEPHPMNSNFDIAYLGRRRRLRPGSRRRHRAHQRARRLSRGMPQCRPVPAEPRSRWRWKTRS
jgi:ABC-type proline/glycine betaine transport system substrate-binding protein